MTLLIACLLLDQQNASGWAYFGVTMLWIFHLGYHQTKP